MPAPPPLLVRPSACSAFPPTPLQDFKCCPQSLAPSPWHRTWSLTPVGALLCPKAVHFISLICQLLTGGLSVLCAAHVCALHGVWYGLLVLRRFSCVQLFATPWTVACQVSPPMGFFQASTLEWVAMPSSRGSFPPRDGTCVYYVCSIGRFFTTSTTWEALGTQQKTHRTKLQRPNDPRRAKILDKTRKQANARQLFPAVSGTTMSSCLCPSQVTEP